MEGRALFTRNVANVLMDLNDTEAIRFSALGGADTITVNDLSGTDVTTVDIDLSAAGGAGDGAGRTDHLAIAEGPRFPFTDMDAIQGFDQHFGGQ